MKHPIWFVVRVVALVIKWGWAIYRRSRMSAFDPALTYLLAREGGLEEQASDPGGISNRGISLRFLKAVPQERLRLYGVPVYVTADTIRELTREQISALYKGEFWDHAAFAQINNQDVCNFVFDMAVNMGISPAIKCLQRALWATRNIRADLVDDGILGGNTLKNANWATPLYLLAAMRSERGGEYRLIAQANPGEKVDLDGWLNRSYNQTL